MAFSSSFSMTLQTEIMSVTSDFLKQMIILKSFKSVIKVVFLCKCVAAVLLFYVHGKHLRSCRDSQLT